MFQDRPATSAASSHALPPSSARAAADYGGLARISRIAGNSAAATAAPYSAIPAAAAPCPRGQRNAASDPGEPYPTTRERISSRDVT